MTDAFIQNSSGGMPEMTGKKEEAGCSKAAARSPHHLNQESLALRSHSASCFSASSLATP